MIETVLKLYGLCALCGDKSQTKDGAIARPSLSQNGTNSSKAARNTSDSSINQPFVT